MLSAALAAAPAPMPTPTPTRTLTPLPTIEQTLAMAANIIDRLSDTDPNNDPSPSEINYVQGLLQAVLAGG